MACKDPLGEPSAVSLRVAAIPAGHAGGESGLHQRNWNRTRCFIIAQLPISHYATLLQFKSNQYL